MLKAVKKTTEVNKSKLKVTASNASENNNNNNNKDNDSDTSELAIKRGSISGQKPEGSANDSPPLKKLSLKGNQLCGSILIGNYNVSKYHTILQMIHLLINSDFTVPNPIGGVRERNGSLGSEHLGTIGNIEMQSKQAN